MKALLFYREESDYRQVVEDFMFDAGQRGLEIEIQDIDSPESQDRLDLYDINEYPAILIVKDDLTLQKLWQGLPMPRIDDVRGYLS